MLFNKLFRDMLKKTEAFQFLDILRDKSPQSFIQIGSILKNYVQGQNNESEVLETIKKQIKDQMGLVSLFNTLVAKDRRIPTISKKCLKEMVDHIINNIKQYPSLLSTLIKVSVDMSKKKLDKMSFLSYDHLIEFYLKELESEDYMNQLGDENFQIIAEILQKFKQQKKEAQIVKTIPNGDKNKTKPREVEPIAEPVLTLDNMTMENQIMEIIKQNLSPENYKIFVKLFYLYHKNVISYVEFVLMNVKVLMKLDKNICLTLKRYIEDREKSRKQKNQFNIKNHVITPPQKDFNLSYKMLDNKELKFDKLDNNLINKTFICLAHGNESSGNNEEGHIKHNIKNMSEQQILKIEDEMHEFDITIQQFRMSLSYLRKIEQDNLSVHQKAAYLQKIQNIKIMEHLYGKKTSQMIELIFNQQNEILPILFSRLEEKIRLLEEEKSKFMNTYWKKSLDTNYYKALDVKSNSIKIGEKRKLANKSLINELKRVQLKNQNLKFHIIVTNTLNKLLSGYPLKRFEIKGENKKTAFWNPVISFSISNKQIIKDIYNFLVLYIKLNKNTNSSEAKKFHTLVKKLIFQYFKFDSLNKEEEKKQNDLFKCDAKFKDMFQDLELLKVDKLQEEISEIEKVVRNYNFLYSEKIVLKLNENKIKELINEFEDKKEVEDKKEQTNVEKEFADVIKSHSSNEEVFQEMNFEKDVNQSS